MRIFTTFAADHGFGTIESAGVTLTQPRAGGHFEVLIPGQGAIARVAAHHLAKMVHRGDAKNVDGRLHILRCDIEKKADGLWLVPCNTPAARDILFFFQWDERMIDGGQLVVDSGAKIVASLKDGLNHLTVIAMTPGASFKVVTDTKRVKNAKVVSLSK